MHRRLTYGYYAALGKLMRREAVLEDDDLHYTNLIRMNSTFEYNPEIDQNMPLVAHKVMLI